MTTFIQIGAGAGDQDPRANFRDGFSEWVKGVADPADDVVVLVEPNPVNIESLNQGWLGWKNVQILNIALYPKLKPSGTDQKLTFYYAEEDSPHYQVFSAEVKHVLKHYPRGTIRAIEVPVRDFDEFLDDYRDGEIALLGCDVEGLDYELLMSTDWPKRKNIKKLSAEFVHMSFCQLFSMVARLSLAGLIPDGYGVDHQRLDISFSRTPGIRRAIMGYALIVHILLKKFKRELFQ